jgi:CheY-like chemotaxis protein
MDLHMPEMDGHETTAKIREIYPHAKQPTIVALTASDTVADTMRCLSHGIGMGIEGLNLALGAPPPAFACGTICRDAFLRTLRFPSL